MRKQIFKLTSWYSLALSVIATAFLLTSCESSPGKMSTVVYTRTAIKLGAPIKAEMLEVRKVEERRIPVGAVRDPGEIVEKVSEYQIEPGQICTVFDSENVTTITFQLDKTTYDKLKAAAKEAKTPINKLAKDYIFAELNEI